MTNPEGYSLNVQENWNLLSANKIEEPAAQGGGYE